MRISTNLTRFFGGLSVMLLGLAGAARGQAVSYGDWQLHLPADGTLQLADAGDRVYVVAENSFYAFDKQLNTTRTLSSRDGLNGVGAVAVAYDSINKQTIVAYRNTNLDFIQVNGRIRNVPDITRKAISGSTTIYRITPDGTGNYAYMATDFGLVVLNLKKYEIADTYVNIGPAGTAVKVYDSTLAHDTLFLATSAGLLRGRLRDNLLDYRNWTISQPVSQSAGLDIYRRVATYNGHVYAGIYGSSLYRFQNQAGGSWQPVFAIYTFRVGALRATPGGLLVSLLEPGKGVYRYDSRTNLATELIPPYPGGVTQDVLRSATDQSYYVASYGQGLLRAKPGAWQAPEQFLSNGPARALNFGLLADAASNKVNVFTGGYSDRYFPNGARSGFYEYADGQWTNYTSQNFPDAAQFPNLVDQVRGTRTPDGTLYVTSYGEGLLEWKGPGQFRVFRDSPFVPYTGSTSSYRIADAATTPEGKVWVVNNHGIASTSGLFILDPATTSWKTIPFFPGSQGLDRIALDDNGWAWVTANRLNGQGGVWVVDPNSQTTNNQPVHFTAADGLPANEMYGVVKDRSGDIWAATISGVAVLSGTGSAFQPGAVRFNTPIVRKGEGANFPALFDQAVRALAVDGGNRKWFGTDNGLWLFSPNADEALAHFTTANSPLPSDRIISLAVNDKTGEVWVGTDNGLVSYRGGATVTEGAPSCAKVSPNPVPASFDRLVGIGGLANNAAVKITDVAGHLVYSTQATGGTLTWNLRDVNGRRVSAGVYLVLSSDADGKNTCVSKVAVLSN